MSSDLAKKIAPPARSELVSQAVVVAFNAAGSPPNCTIKLRGDATAIPGVRYFSFYAPTVNDVVWLIWNGPDPMIVGKLT